MNIKKLFKDSEKVKYRVQIVNYHDLEKPTEFYPQRKGSGIFSTWEFYYEPKELPTSYESWKDKIFEKRVDYLVQCFSTYEEAKKYLKKKRNLEVKGIQSIEVQEVNFEDEETK